MTTTTNHPRLGWLRLFPPALLAGLVATAPAVAQDAVRLELVETVPPEITESDMTVAPGKIAFIAPQIEGISTWTEIPQSIDLSGFTVTLGVSGRIAANPNQPQTRVPMATSLSGAGFTTTPSPARVEIKIGYGEGDSASSDVNIVPDADLTDGQIVELRVGADIGTGAFFLYRYRVSNGGTPPPGGDNQIVAEVADCPATIVISELPSTTCHLRISGFRHNTADPVQVILPSAMDGMGNHGNGLQVVITASAMDVSLMDDPHLWAVTLFACPGQQGAGVMCNGTGAAPGLLSVPIVVRQEGAGETQVMLGITAVAGKNSVLGNGTGAAVTSTSVPAGPGQIGARIDCPGIIFISALPSLNCHVVITGWLKDTDAPVRVLFPATIDEFGNHANGIQVVGGGEEDHYEWDNEDSHSWGFFVFACPGQSSTGANCNQSTTTPGVQSVAVIVEQDGLAPASITLMIDAQPHP